MQSRISTPMYSYINAESLRRSSIGRARASCSTRSPTSFLPDVQARLTLRAIVKPSHRIIAIKDHSTLEIPSSTELPSTSLRRLEPQYSGTFALAVEDVLLITNSPTKAGAHRCRHPTHFVNKFEVPKLRTCHQMRFNLLIFYAIAIFVVPRIVLHQSDSLE